MKAQLQVLSDILGFGPNSTKHYIGIDSDRYKALMEGEPATQDDLAAIINTLDGVDAGWLLTGKGKPFNKRLLHVAEEMPESKHKEITERVRSLRMAHGLTQYDFADKIDIHRSTIASCEMGRQSYTLEHLITIGRMFRVSMDFLILGKKL